MSTITRRRWMAGMMAVMLPTMAWAKSKEKHKHKKERCRMRPRIDLGYHFATEAAAQAALTKLHAALVGRDIFDQPIAPYYFWDSELNAWVVLSDTRFNVLADWTTAKTALEAAMLTDGTRDQYLPDSYVISFMSHQDEGQGGALDRAEMTKTIM